MNSRKISLTNKIVHLNIYKRNLTHRKTKANSKFSINSWSLRVKENFIFIRLIKMIFIKKQHKNQ